jgi:amino acid transporter
VYWMGIAFLLPSAALFYMGTGLSALSPSFSSLDGNRFALLAVSLAAIWIALGSNIVGLKIGKWTQNLGGASTWILGGLLITVAALVWAKRGAATSMQLVPKWSWGTVSFWSNIAYGMSGLEMAGMMGSEIHDPERTLPRAGWIASAFVTLFYAGATVAMLVLLRPEAISEMNGWAEAGGSAALALGWAWLPGLIAVLVMANGMGQFGGMGTSVSRLPFAAGTDHLLPEPFGRIHPRWGTPHISILVFGAVASFLLLVFQLGDSLRAAYQELVSLMVITGFLPYVYIFASCWKAGKRFSAVSGSAITALAILCTIVPTDEITNVWLFEGKLAAGTLAVIASAWVVYARGARPR